MNILFWVVDYQYAQGDPAMLPRYFMIYFTSWGTHAIFFYTLFLFLIPKLLFKGKYLLFILLYLIGAAGNLIAHIPLWNDLTWHNVDALPEGQLINLLGWQVIILFYSTAMRFWEEWTSSEEGKISLQNEVKTSEIKFLKSQMSPHFLFNTLNNIYSLSISGESKTSLALNQLKNMMGYVNHFESGSEVNIKTEIAYLEDYIALNQLRYRVPVEFNTQIINENRVIEPMLFLPFIENAFKHGDTSKNGFIHISLKEVKSKIQFDIANKIGIQKRKDEVSGVGIANVKKRIQLMYPTNKFEVLNDANTFTIKLEL